MKVSSSMSPLATLNLALRGIMEAGVVAGFAFWGFHEGDTTLSKVLLGVIAPSIAFGFWGAVDFHQVGRFAEAARLAQELVVSGLASAAFYVAGRPALALALVSVSVVHHGLVYCLGERLLDEGDRQRGASSPMP